MRDQEVKLSDLTPDCSEKITADATRMVIWYRYKV